MNSIITSFLQQIDTAAVTIVSTAYGSLAGSLAGVFRAILLFYVVWWGYLVLLGRTTYRASIKVRLSVNQDETAPCVA